MCACGDNVTGTRFEDLVHATDDAKCERFVRCGLFPDDGSCNRFFRHIPETALISAVQAGITRYDGPSATQCNADLAAMTCNESAREARVPTRACEDVFIGTRNGGEPCGFDDECRSGSCSIPACGELCCVGTCRDARAPSEVGGPCEVDRQCVSDTFCGTDGVCHPLAGEGAQCADDGDCDYGLGCIGPNSLMPGNCRKLPLLGEACLYERCAELNAICKNGVCTALGLPGAPCVQNTDCSPFMECVDTTCVALPELGSSCLDLCAGDSYCDENKTCMPTKQNGAFCMEGSDCQSGLCEDGPAFSACTDFPVCF